MKRLLFVGLWLLVTALAQSTPLTRYFPDHALAVFEINDVQGALEQTGQFGEETLQTLTALAGSGLQELLEDSARQAGFGVAANLGVRSLAGSLRDAVVAVYTNPRTAEPQFLAVARLGQFGPIGRLVQDAVNKSVQNRRIPKLREGAYVAAREDEFWFGMQNGLAYLSNNADLLRGYLRRIQGNPQPVLVNGAAYRTAMGGVGRGWLRYYINLSSVAQVINRIEPLPPKATAALRTLNVLAGAQAVTTRGVENRTLTLLNPGGGDGELYRLLTYSPERLSLPDQMGAQAVGSFVFALDVPGWLDYFLGWADFIEEIEGGASSESEQARKLLADLKGYLGNEWGLTVPDTTTQYLSAGFWEQLLSLSELEDAASLRRVVEGLKGYSFFATVQDGARALEAIAVGLGNEPEVAVERLEFAGSPGLRLASEGLEVFLAAKANVVMIGFDRESLESTFNPRGALAAAPDFRALTLPARLTGVSLVRPIKLERTQIETLMDNALRGLGAEQAEVPASVRRSVVNWLESFYGRLETGYGYAVVNNNRLQTFGLSGFRWR